MNYQELKKQISDSVSNFEGMFFAFSQSQLDEGMKKIGVTDKSLLVTLGAGCVIKKDRVQAFHEMNLKSDKDLKDFLNASYENFYPAIKYELNNHEFCITGNSTDALDSLGLEYKDLLPFQVEALRKAKKEIMDEQEW